MDIKSLVLKQEAYFSMLSDKTITPVYVWDGAGHKFFYGKNKHVYYISSLLKSNKLVQDRLRYDSREIIFDPNDSWENVKLIGNKIITYLKERRIPYELLYTGRNVRIHIYLEDNVRYSARKRRIETQELCFKIYQYLCYLIGIDWRKNGVPENKQKHHLIGTIGKRNIKTGYYATYLYDGIPDKQPQTTLSDVRFPRSNSFTLWKMDQQETFLDNVCDYTAKIPEAEIQKVFSNTKYFGAMSVVRF